MKSSATANPVMTGVAVKYLSDARSFVGLRLFPLFPTGEQSASYYVLDDVNLLNIPRNIQRAPGTPYSRAQMKVSDDTYNCREFGHEEPVDDRERRKYANSFDADAAAVRRASNVLIVNHEIRVYNLATSGSVPTTSPSTKWDDSGSDPVGDVDTAKSAINKGTGMEANVMVLSRDVFNVLKEHSQVQEKIKYSERGVVTADILAAVFGVDEVLIAGAMENTAQEGQTVSSNYIWGDSVVLAHVEAGNDLMLPNFGRTFGWIGETGPDGVLVETYRDDKVRSDVHRARHDVAEKIIGSKAGYHLSNVLS